MDTLVPARPRARKNIHPRRGNDEHFHQRFGANLQRLRTAAKIGSQGLLAEMMFVDPSAVAHWERGGACPNLARIPELCRHLKCSYDQLLEGCK